MTTTYAPVPLHHLPRGLTVVAAGHRDEFNTAYAAFRELVTRHLVAGDAIEETVLAAVWGELYRRHIRPLHEQVDVAQAQARETRLQMSAYETQAEARREADTAALLRRRLQAERRDKALRDAVRARDGDQCRYCGTEVALGAGGGAVLDHITPDLAAGADNLVTACRPCRRRKRNRTPQAAGMSLRLPPTSPHLITESEREESMTTTANEAGQTQPPGRVRLTVTYPEGTTAEVAWSAVAEEPTPDELAEMIKTLAPDLDPANIQVVRPPSRPPLAEHAPYQPLIELPFWGSDEHGNRVTVSKDVDGIRFHSSGVGGVVMSWGQAEEIALAVLRGCGRKAGAESIGPSSELEKL